MEHCPGEYSSARYNVEKTRRNLELFQTITSKFFDAHSQSILIDVDAVTGNKTYKVVFEGNLPAEARDAVSGAIADLRHALDMAMCATYEIVKGEAAPKHLYFPRGRSAEDVRGKLRKTELPANVIDYLVSLQPHPTESQNTIINNRLLCDLVTAAQSKHRIACALDANVEEVWIKATVKDAVSLSVPPRWDFEEQEAVLCTVGPQGHFEANYSFALEIIFVGAGPLTGWSVEQALLQLCDLCDTIILGLSLVSRENRAT
tara:strand:- start:180 stop:959 length:780 start_codon:yes stop_codon:yes gene_type:complete